MAMIDDINKFCEYISKTYGTEIKIARFVNEPITRESQVVDIWATAISEYFQCSKDRLFKKNRTGNSVEKIWLQYFLMEKEHLTTVKIFKMFGYKDHTSIHSNIRSCKGWRDVYPEVYDGIMAIYEREIKKLGLDKQINIV